MSRMERRAKVELFEQMRREYEFGMGTIQGVAELFGGHRRLVRQALKDARMRLSVIRSDWSRHQARSVDPTGIDVQQPARQRPSGRANALPMEVSKRLRPARLSEVIPVEAKRDVV
jgi:hypothetical protein